MIDFHQHSASREPIIGNYVCLLDTFYLPILLHFFRILFQSDHFQAKVTHSDTKSQYLFKNSKFQKFQFYVFGAILNSNWTFRGMRIFEQKMTFCITVSYGLTPSLGILMLLSIKQLFSISKQWNVETM